MTQRQVERLFAEWQARPGLHEWRLSFREVAPEDEPGDDDERFDVRVRSHTHYRWAVLYVTRRWRLDAQPRDRDPDALVIHELLHLELRPLSAVAEVCTPTDETAAGPHEWQATNAEEVIVDRLSYALATAWEGS